MGNGDNIIQLQVWRKEIHVLDGGELYTKTIEKLLGDLIGDICNGIVIHDSHPTLKLECIYNYYYIWSAIKLKEFNHFLLC